MNNKENQMNYWLHRISHHAELSYPLLEKGILSIGWADCANKDFISQCDNNWDSFEKSIEASYESKPRSRYGLWRFLFEMKKGDYVIVPSWGIFSIFEFVDDIVLSYEELDISNLQDWSGAKIVKGKNGYLYKNDDSTASNCIDLGFFRAVKPVLEKIPRSEYADSALTSRMKIYQTNSDISDLKANILQSIEMFRIKKPINLQSLIIDNVQSGVLELIKKHLNPDKFEYLIKWYFEKVGATDVIIPSKTKNANEKGDVDIIATFEKIKTIIFVQAKYHTEETSSWALNQISEFKNSREAMDDGYSKIAWVVTSADKFSDECYDLAKNANVLLINGPQLVTMLIEAGISNINNAFK